MKWILSPFGFPSIRIRDTRNTLVLKFLIEYIELDSQVKSEIKLSVVNYQPVLLDIDLFSNTTRDMVTSTVEAILQQAISIQVGKTFNNRFLNKMYTQVLCTCYLLRALYYH